MFRLTLGHPTAFENRVFEGLSSILPFGGLVEADALRGSENSDAQRLVSQRSVCVRSLQFSILLAFGACVVVRTGLLEEGFGGDVAQE